MTVFAEVLLWCVCSLIYDIIWGCNMYKVTAKELYSQTSYYAVTLVNETDNHIEEIEVTIAVDYNADLNDYHILEVRNINTDEVINPGLVDLDEVLA